MSRTRRTAYGFAADLAFQIVFLTTGFVTTPWILRWLGEDRYGSYRVVLDWLSILGALEWGLGGALMAALAISLARRDGRTPALLRAGLHAYLVRAGWMFAAALAFTWVTPHLLGSSTVPPNELRAAAAISSLTLLLTPLLLFRSLAEAEQAHYRVTLAMLVQTLVLNAAWLAAAWGGYGLVGQAWGLVLAQACGLGLIAVAGRSRVGPSLRVPLEREEVASLRRRSQPVFVLGLVDRLLLASGNLTIAWLLGPAIVVPFYVTQRLAAVVQAQLKAVGDSSWAGLTELHVAGHGSVMHGRLVDLTNAVSGAGIAILAVLVAYNGHFVARWVGESLYAGDAVTILGAIDAWLLSLYALWMAPVFGLGELRRWLPQGLAFAAITVLAGGVFTLRWGPVGPLLGALAGFLTVVAWGLPSLLRELVASPPGELWAAALKPLAWGAPWAVILFTIARVRAPEGWTGLGVESAAAACGGFLLWWSLSLDRDGRTRWRARVREAMA